MGHQRVTNDLRRYYGGKIIDFDTARVTKRSPVILMADQTEMRPVWTAYATKLLKFD